MHALIKESENTKKPVDIQRKKPVTVEVTGFIFWRRRRDLN